ncbi:hemerythrin family protein [Oscillospiraceae bacterium CM]|nr:hemerythrin family protein [Oscillospiraceae bacterium CM]
MAVRWRNSTSCNIKEIDNQHKKLFEISSKLNILEPICTQIDFKDEILDVIDQLKDYSIYHFTYEESLMQKYHYPDYEEHRDAHKAFIKKILDLENGDVNFSSSESLRHIIDFINGWVMAHILKTDMKYKDFFNNLGIE